MSGTPRVKKSNACIPCHERKVKCDAGTVGTPCSRCLSKARVHSCIPVTRRARRYKHGHVEPVNVPTYNGAGNDGSYATTQSQATYPATPGSELAPTAPYATAVQETPYHVSEEDAQIQTLHRMADSHTVIDLSGPPDHTEGSSARHHIEYLDRLNSVSLLCEALGHRQPKRLVQVELPGPNYVSAKQRELVDLDAADVAYLESRRVFDPPEYDTCVSLLRIYFDYIHPYCPVFDRLKFYSEFRSGSLSHFVLFAILANVVPYAPLELVQQAGYEDKTSAQHDFYLKAQLLHDFGCERSQLSVLQGSIPLSTFHYHFAPARDHRFWFHNAVRLATQLGLHRQKLGSDLDPATHRVCRRIWWVLYSRDVLFSLSGFGNARAINDEESDTTPSTEDDWLEGPIDEAAQSMLPEITTLQKQFFVQNCELARLGAKFLRISRTNQLPRNETTIFDFADEIAAWRRRLPEALSASHVRSWSRENVWVIVLHALSYRLECTFYRFSRELMVHVDNPSTVTWCRQQLWGCVFELDTWMNRAVVNDLIQYCPSSMIVCAANLLAFHIEIALDSAASASQKLSAKAHIHTMLAYLHDISSSWRMARWIHRVSEWVVRRAGLMLKDDIGTLRDASHGTGAEVVDHHQDRVPAHSGGGGLSNSGAGSAPDIEGLDAGNVNSFNSGDRYDNAAPFRLDGAFPEPWVQDFLGESFFGQLDDEILAFGGRGMMF